MKRRIAQVACCSFLLLATAARAENCTTQSQMKPAERDALAARGQQLATWALSGDTEKLQQASVPELSASFSGVSAAVAALKPAAAGRVTVSALYSFTAAPAGQAETPGVFYCGTNTPERVVISLPGLQPAQYALALMRVSGVDDPRSVSLVLEAPSGAAIPAADNWKLAGFISRSLTYAGHDGVWFWTQARAYQKKQQRWNASVFYQAAKQLSLPVDFLSSANAQKLEDEQSAALPPDWPSPDKPLALSVSGRAVSVTALHPAFLKDAAVLSMDATADTTSATQQPAVSPADVAAAIEGRLPELKSAFTGIYVHIQNQNVTTYVPVKGA